MGRRAKRLFHAALLVPLLAFAVTTLDFAHFLCSMDGALRDRCCCPSPADEASDARTADPAARIGATPCCSLRRLTLDRAPSEPPRDRLATALLATEWVAVAFTLAPPPAPTPAVAFARWPHPPPRSAPTRLALKQSFLI